MAEHRVGELGARVQRLELVAEVRAEELVDGGEHLGPRAVVSRQRQQLCRLRAARTEYADVSVPEAVDRLELVADEEELGVRGAQQVDEVALEAVRVLELVDHDRAEAEALALADRLVVAQQIARVQLEVLEVERRLARLPLRVRSREAREQLLEQDAVANRRLVERCLLDGLPRLLVRRRTLARGAKAGEVHEPVRARVALEQRKQLLRIAALKLRRRRVVSQAPRRVAQLGDAVLELREDLHGEVEVPARGAQRLVDTREHAPQAVGAVRRQEPQPVGLIVGAELGERLLERLAAEHRALCVIELAKARVQAGGKRIALQEPEAEAVDRRDPRAVELAREVLPTALRERCADAGAQLAGGASRVRDDEDRLDVEPAVAHGAHETLDEHRSLPRTRPCRDEDLAGRLDRRLLLLVHPRSIRQIGHRSHQAGQSPPFGSCFTSPTRMRPPRRRAVSFAVSTMPQNASSSR